MVPENRSFNLVYKKLRKRKKLEVAPPVVSPFVPPPHSAESSTICVEKYQKTKKIKANNEDGILNDPPKLSSDQSSSEEIDHSISSEQSSSEDIDHSITREVDETNDESNNEVSNEIEEIDDCGWRLVKAVEGGPTDISLLTSYRGHVAYVIWKNKDRGVLQCQTRVKALNSWKMNDDEGWVTIVEKTGFAYLSDCMFNHLNAPLISAFIERWHPETNSFHFPFGEISITLHDVVHLLNLKVDGLAVYDAGLARKSIDEEKSLMDLIRESLSRCLDVPLDTLKAPGEMKGCAIKLSTINTLSTNLDDQGKARAYIFTLLGSLLFVDKSFDKANGFIMPLLEDLTKVSDYAWGTATLAYLYRQLGIASRSGVKSIGGCLSLLEAWIYEYFPKLAPRTNPKYISSMPRACKWIYDSAYPKGTTELDHFRDQLDRMKSHEVEWLPFGRDPHVDCPSSLYEGVIQFLDIIESYMPQRFIRQYGFVQHIPENPFPPEKYSRPANGTYVVEHPI